jgi:hypothetical protein
MSHPYRHFENTSLWAVLERELAALQASHDIQLTTSPVYVIGSLAAALADSGLVQPEALRSGTI